MWLWLIIVQGRISRLRVAETLRSANVFFTQCSLHRVIDKVFFSPTRKGTLQCRSIVSSLQKKKKKKQKKRKNENMKWSCVVRRVDSFSCGMSTSWIYFRREFVLRAVSNILLCRRRIAIPVVQLVWPENHVYYWILIPDVEQASVTKLKLWHRDSLHGRRRVPCYIFSLLLEAHIALVRS